MAIDVQLLVNKAYKITRHHLIRNRAMGNPYSFAHLDDSAWFSARRMYEGVDYRRVLANLIFYRIKRYY